MNLTMITMGGRNWLKLVENLKKTGRNLPSFKAKSLINQGSALSVTDNRRLKAS